MAEKYQNKYRVPSARLQHWDYALNAAYFVTICTKSRLCFFGEILQTTATIQLSEIGKIVQSEWLKTPEIRPDMNLKLGAFIVMPNHFHGIITIGENQYNTDHCRDAMHGVSTEIPTSTTDNVFSSNDVMPGVSSFGPQSKNLASIIRGFKSSVTTQTRKFHPGFAWQARFHDHIIRDEISFQNISAYILNNPSKWSADKFFI